MSSQYHFSIKHITDNFVRGTLLQTQLGSFIDFTLMTGNGLLQGKNRSELMKELTIKIMQQLAVYLSHLEEEPGIDEKMKKRNISNGKSKVAGHNGYNNVLAKAPTWAKMSKDVSIGDDANANGSSFNLTVEKASILQKVATDEITAPSSIEDGNGSKQIKLQNQNSHDLLISSDISFGICETLSNVDASHEANTELFRYFTIINISKMPIYLLKVTTSGSVGSLTALSIHDDFGIACNETQQRHTQNGSAFRTNKSVLLQPGDHYGICVKLDRRRAITGAEERWLLFTFGKPRKGGEPDCFVVGRRVSYCIARRPQEVHDLSLNIDANPFVPDHIRLIFSEPPLSFIPLTLNNYFYEKPTGARYAVTSPAFTHAILILMMAGESAALMNTTSSDSHTNKQSFRPYEINQTRNYDTNKNANEFKKHALLLLLEALAQERHMNVFDVYNQPVITIAIDIRTRRWQDLHGNEQNGANGRYGGSLAALPGGVALALRMPELLEGKPPLAMFDSIHLRPAAGSKMEIGGLVLALDGEYCIFLISVEAHNVLKDYGRNPLIHARFIGAETALRQMHQAMTRGVYNPTCIIPSNFEAMKCLEEEDATQICNNVEEDDAEMLKQLEINEEQWSAVKKISLGVLPKVIDFERQEQGNGNGLFVVLGPPGTGKTRTVIASIEYIAKTRAESYMGARILACTPTDFAADIIADGLMKRNVPGVLRINDPRRFVATVKESVLDVCLLDEETQVFRWPTLTELFDAKVIVCSCISSGTIHAALSQGVSFSHIIIDEAGQALVPETCVPLSLASSSTFIALVGDPKQLGPTVHSKVATEGGMGFSLLERWVRFYKKNNKLFPKKASSAGVHLVRNYRSNAALLALPNKMFYDGQLIACNEEDESTKLPDISGWAGFDMHSSTGSRLALSFEGDFFHSKSAPIFYYGIFGQQAREPDSPSYYNALEASQVTILIEGLIVASKGKLVIEDIGVIAPYRLQVRKLRKLLRSRGYGAIRVGTVDDFQGQEAKVIFISTVVTSQALMTKDKSTKYQSNEYTKDANELKPLSNTSFLCSSKRFNVAITRARAMLVVVGHPLALQCDENWLSLMRFCAKNKTFAGAGMDMVVDMADLATDKDAVQSENRSLDALDFVFPETLDDIYDYNDVFSDDLVARVML